MCSVVLVLRVVICLAAFAGHQQLINDVKFSPNTRFIASASFDKSVKLWDGKTGRFVRGCGGLDTPSRPSLCMLMTH